MDRPKSLIAHGLVRFGPDGDLGICAAIATREDEMKDPCFRAGLSEPSGL